MKQFKVDNGQIGGALSIIMNSMFIFNLITFVNTCAIAYDSFLHRWVSLSTGIILIVGGACSWFYFYYAIIYPSTMAFVNRQAYAHDSPIKKDFEEINKELKEIKEMLNT